MTTEFFIHDDKNVRQAVLSNLVSAQYTLLDGRPGAAQVVLPSSEYDISEIGRDYRLQIERNGKIEGDTQFIIRKRKKTLDKRGERLFVISGWAAVGILARRWVLYYAGSSQASQTASADDMIKAIARQNLGSGAQHADRDIAAPDLSSYFAVEADSSAVSLTSKQFSRRPVLTVLQEIAKDAWQAGEWLGFDVVLNDAGLLELRTYTGQRGTDRSSATAASVLFSPQRGNLTEIERTWDWTREVTVAIAAGQNTGASRGIETATDVRKDDTVLNWIERVADARNTSTTAGLEAEARAMVRGGRPRDVFTARLLDTPGSKRGEDWDYGDKAACEFEGETFDIRIDGLKVEIDRGGHEKQDAAMVVE